MKYANIAPILLMIFAAAPALTEDKIGTIYADSAIIIDGKIDDWNKLDPRYYTKDDAVIGICNDDQNLYIQLRFRNEQQATMIRREGLKIWIDNKGKKNEYYQLSYNGGPAPVRRRPAGDRNGDQIDDEHDRPPGEQPPEDRGGQPNAVELKSYREGWRSPRTYSLDSSDPVAAAFDTSFSFQVYEFRIPLGDSAHAPDGINLTDKDRWSLGIEMAEVKESLGGRSGPPPGDSFGGGPPGGGRGGGGRKGGMGDDMFGGGGRSGPPQRKAEMKKTWYKFTLSQPEK